MAKSDIIKVDKSEEELETARKLVYAADQAELEHASDKIKEDRKKEAKRLADRKVKLAKSRGIQKCRRIAAKALVKKAVEMEKAVAGNNISKEVLAWLKLHK